MTDTDLRAGIAAYAPEQLLLLRLLRRRGHFTADEFDAWFQRPRRGLFVPRGGIDGDSFILGMGMNGGSQWAFMLELLQIMMRLQLVTTRRRKGELVYLPMSAAAEELHSLEAARRDARRSLWLSKEMVAALANDRPIDRHGRLADPWTDIRAELPPLHVDLLVKWRGGRITSVTRENPNMPNGEPRFVAIGITAYDYEHEWDDLKDPYCGVTHWRLMVEGPKT